MSSQEAHRDHSTINATDEVMKRLGQIPAAAAPASTDPAAPPPEPEPPAAEPQKPEPPAGEPAAEPATPPQETQPAAPADVNLDEELELNVRGAKSRAKLRDVVTDRERLTRALQRDENYEQLLKDFDAKRDREAQRMAIQRDIDRGLIRVNPMTGQLEETELSQRIRSMGAEPANTSPPAGSPVDVEVDLQKALTDAERTQVETLLRKETSEAYFQAQSIMHRATARAAAQAAREATLRELAPRVREVDALRDHISRAETTNAVKLVNDTIAAESAFVSEEQRAFARSAVASELRQGKPLNDALGAVSRVAAFLRGGSAGNQNSTPPQNGQPPAPAQPAQRQQAPRPTGHGATQQRPAPGPAPRGADGKFAAPNGNGQPEKIRLGDSRVVDEVTRRLIASRG